MNIERCLCIFPSDLGWMGLIVATDNAVAQVERLTFGHANQTEVAATLRAVDRSLRITNYRDTEIWVWVRVLQAYSAGKAANLSMIPIRNVGFTTFEIAVRHACQKIPRGEVRTYGELAQMVGHLGAARAVGNVMRKNPTPLLVPCHRVVGRQGLGNFSAPQGVAMKRRLLEMEATANRLSERVAAAPSDVRSVASV